jgi:hypothetical protein
VNGNDGGSEEALEPLANIAARQMASGGALLTLARMHLVTSESGTNFPFAALHKFGNYRGFICLAFANSRLVSFDPIRPKGGEERPPAARCVDCLPSSDR